MRRWLDVGRLLAALAALLCAAFPLRAGAAPARQTPREAFDRGRTAFGRAEYHRAIEILNPLLYPEVLLESEGEVVQAHRMLGVAYLYENRPEDAKREFHKLLELRPDYRFDPLLDPQPIVDAFNAVVKEEEAEIAAIESRRRERDQEAAARRLRDAQLHPAVPPTVIVYERHSYVLNFVPFGAGQFQNGQRRKGWLFFGVEAGLAAISIGALVTNFALYGVQPHRGCKVMVVSGMSPACPGEQIDYSQEQTSQDLLRVQLVSGGLFFAAAIWGVLDAIRHYQRDVLLPQAPPAGGLRIGLGPYGLSAQLKF